MSKNFKGEERQVGFEIEFQNLTPLKTAELIKDCAGGNIDKESDASFIVHTHYGEFKAETDAKLLKKLAKSSEDNIKVEKFDFEGVVKDIISPITEELVPTEIVSPPLKMKDFKVIEKIEKAIIKANAKGTNESSYFAFAMQFNPEIKEKDPKYILNVLRSYILMSSWLRSQIDIGLSREITGYVDDFPTKYALKVLAPDYAPNIDELINDYLMDNPTRNRGLDLLPLFLFCDKERVRSKVVDDRVKSRPTFHYRLPSSQIGLESWNIGVEWKRWCLVEKISEDTEFLNKLAKSFIKIYNDENINKKNKWLQVLNHFIEDYRH